MKEWIKSRDWPLIAVFLLCIFLCLFLVKTRVYGQELIPQKIDANTISKAKVGDVLMRKGNAEYRKAPIAGQITAKVFSTPQWDENGAPLLTYDASTNTVTSRMRTVQYIPDAETKKLTKKVEKGNAVVKEFYTVPDNKTTQLTWEVKTTANETRFDSKTGTLNYFDSQGILLFTTLPPVAWDALKKDVPIEISFESGVLSYIISSGGWTYPVTVDPTSVIATNDGMILSQVDAVYENARDATAGTAVYTTIMRVGQVSSITPTFYIYRAFLSFAIPNMTELTAASLFLNGAVDESTVDFEIYIHTSTYSNPLVVADFDQFAGWQASGAYNGTVLNNVWNSSSYSADWNEIVFNAAGLAAILAKKNDTFKITGISKNDFDSSAPTYDNDQDVGFRTTSTAGEEPYLSITYTLASDNTRSILSKDGVVTALSKDGVVTPLWSP